MRYILLLFILATSFCKRTIDLGPLPIGGNFSYAEKSGKVVSLSDFKEPVLLVFFGYTQCPDFCPNMLTKIKQAQAILSKDGKPNFRTVFISIDPARDSSDVAQKYVEFYLDHATGLSFNESTTKLLAKKYAAYVEQSQAAATIDHSTYVYVLDQDRKTRILLKSNETPEYFAEVIDTLGREAIQSK